MSPSQTAVGDVPVPARPIPSVVFTRSVYASRGRGADAEGFGTHAGAVGYRLEIQEPRMTSAAFVLSLLIAASAEAQTPQATAAPQRNAGGGQCQNNPFNCADAANPLPPPDTVWLEEMTWMDVRDAMKAG